MQREASEKNEIKDFWLLQQNCPMTKKSRVSFIEKYFKVFFRENRISITSTTEEKKALQNMLVANIVLGRSW